MSVCNIVLEWLLTLCLFSAGFTNAEVLDLNSYQIPFLISVSGNNAPEGTKPEGKFYCALHLQKPCCLSA